MNALNTRERNYFGISDIVDYLSIEKLNRIF